MDPRPPPPAPGASPRGRGRGRGRGGGAAPRAPLPCPTCGRLFRFPYYLSRHRLSHSGLRPHACPLCPKAFRRPAHLARHLRGHGPQPPLRCAACPRTFPEPAQLQLHLAQEHGGGGEPAGTEAPGGREPVAEPAPTAGPPEDAQEEAAELARAAAGRGEEKEVLLQADWTLLCLRCREAFPTKGELKAHPCLRSSGGRAGPDGEPGPPPRPKRHQCSVCLKAFARPWSLSRHRLVHSPDRPFACPDCGLAFRLASYLRQHRRVHGALSLLAPAPAPARPDKEERGVGGPSKGWNFARGADAQGQHGEDGAGLEGERASGPGEEPPPPPPPPVEPRFRCPECGKGFRRRAHLRQHGVTHSGARPFQCVRCQREFKRLADLARHAQVHAGGPAPHPCPRCPRRFSRAYSLLRHQRCHRAEMEGAPSRAPAPDEAVVPPPAETVEDPPSPPSPSRTPPAAPAYLSASCFDSQDHSAFDLEEEEEGAPGGAGRVPS